METPTKQHELTTYNLSKRTSSKWAGDCSCGKWFSPVCANFARVKELHDKHKWDSNPRHDIPF